MNPYEKAYFLTTPSGRKPLLREREGPNKVTSVELFFDLVFVFAITQVSHALMHHFTPVGALHALMLMLGVWWVWIFTSWVTNWLDPERLAVRFAMLVLMLLGLFLSASIPQAFEEKGWTFAGAYVAMQVGRSAFFLWAVRGEQVMVRNFQRILAWLVVSGGFWLAGAAAHDWARLALWGMALAIEYAGPSQGFWTPGLGRSSAKDDWDVEGGHLAERCGLFVIIALGESILVTGGTFAERQWNWTTLAAFVSSFVGSLAMWWLYFDTGAEAGGEKLAKAEDPGRLARLAYTYIHLLIVGGIVLSAVADEFVLNPDGRERLPTAVALLGSSAVYLLGNLLFKRAALGKWRRSHVAGLVALAVTTPFALSVSPLALSVISTVVLVAAAAVERPDYKRNTGVEV